MFSYTITIGRDYTNNGETFTAADDVWASFQRDVIASLAVLGSTGNVETHLGTGTWNGVTEESAKITLLTDEPVTDDAVFALTEHLTILARAYDQDAIALTLGESILIGA